MYYKQPNGKVQNKQYLRRKLRRKKKKMGKMWLVIILLMFVLFWMYGAYAGPKQNYGFKFY